MKIFQLLLAIVISSSYCGQTFTNYTTSDGLIDNNVLCGAVGDSGVIWFGTQNGISKFDGNIWTNFNKNSHPGLVDNTITAIQTISSGDIWIGTDFGVCKYSGSNWSCFTTSDGLGDNRVKYIKEAPNGDIWIGEYDGLTIFDGSSWTSYNTSDGLPFGGIQFITFDNSSDSWMGSGFGGLIKFDGSNFIIINSNNNLINNVVNGIAIDNLNKKWVGTSAGISIFNNDDNWINNFTKMYLLPPPDTLNPVMALEFDSKDLLWAGIYVDYLLDGGVAMYNGYCWVDFNVNDGLIGPVITDLIIDELDQVWITTSSGISKLTNVPANINIISTETISIYPNPNNGEFIIKNQSLEEFELKIKNINNQLIEQHSINNKTTNINLDAPNGIYILEFKNKENQIINKKFIKNI